MKTSRVTVSIHREEVRARYGAEYHWAHKWVYRVEGVAKPLATLKRAEHAAKKKHGKDVRLVRTWKESP